MPTNFSKLTQMFSTTSDPRLQRGFAQIIHALISTKSCIMSDWARCSYNFGAFIKKAFRYFRNESVDWKIGCAILKYLLPRFVNKKWFPVLIDNTFVPNNTLGVLTKTQSDQEKARKGFFILSAALPVRGRAISFFQHHWRYTQISHMVEYSFNNLIAVQLIKIKTLLKQVLSKAVFIMDRGFGYEYFFKKFIELEVNYVVRIRDLNTNVVLARGKKKIKLKDLAARSSEPIVYKVLYKSKTPINVVFSKKRNSIWALATNLDDPKVIIDLYRQRMKIEECFKDWKSTGFNIEKIQILQWDVLPKMIWCVVVAHLLLYLLGETIDRSKQHKKLFKKFIQYRNNLSCVQLAWKAWLFALNDILPLFQTLLSRLSATTEVL